MTNVKPRWIPAAVALTMAACGGELSLSGPEHGLEEDTIRKDALSAEMPGVAEFAYRQYRKNGEVGLASFAVVRFPNCAGTMIGPNTMITAAHCGLQFNATFQIRPSGGPGSPIIATTGTYHCEYLIHTFPDSDMNIYFCDPSADGVNPGDRHGYIDLEANPSRPAVGRAVYDLWTNLQPTNNAPAVMIYSPGQVVRNDVSQSDLWSLPDGAGSVGMQTNVTVEAGASGSPQLDASTHRMVIGPLSLAAPTASADADAVSMYDYLYWGHIDSTAATPPVNAGLLSLMSLNPQNYGYWLDDNLDWEFDVQLDLERLRGERHRSLYNLSFDSPRRNRLWTVGSGGGTASFNGRIVEVSRSDDGSGTVLAHTRLNLRANEHYVLSGFARQRSGNGSIWVGLRSDSGDFSGQWINPSASGGTFAIPVTAIGAKAEVNIWLSGSGSFDLSELVLGRNDGPLTFDFETHDQRKLWTETQVAGAVFDSRFPNPLIPFGVWGGQGNMIPDGKSVSGVAAAFALYVPTSSSGTFVTRIDRIPVVPNQAYKICFDHMRDSFSSTSSRATILLRGGSSDQTVNVDVGSGWATACVDRYTPLGAMTMMFGVASGDAYRIDNLTFTPVP